MGCFVVVISQRFEKIIPEKMVLQSFKKKPKEHKTDKFKDQLTMSSWSNYFLTQKAQAWRDVGRGYKRSL